MALTDMQKKFVIEYVDCYNATQAAIRAGYSEKTARQQGSRLLTNVDVLARVREEQEKAVERSGISQARVILALWDVYERCMTAVPVMEFDRGSGQMIETGEYTFDSKGALRALELVGKYLGMFNDKGKPGDKENEKRENNIFEAIMNGTKEDVSVDEIRELQHTAESDSDVVEQA